MIYGPGKGVDKRGYEKYINNYIINIHLQSCGTTWNFSGEDAQRPVGSTMTTHESNSPNEANSDKS